MKGAAKVRFVGGVTGDDADVGEVEKFACCVRVGIASQDTDGVFRIFRECWKVVRRGIMSLGGNLPSTITAP